MSHTNVGDAPPVRLVMGKGGVGKSTVAAGLALLEARRRGRAVLVTFEDAARLAALPQVEQVVITATEALRRGGAGLFGSAAVARLALDNFAMRPLLKAAPAVRELAMLEAVRQVAADRPGAAVVVDMPATGHGVAWLRTARQGRAFLGSGPLHDLCDRLVRELIAPGRATPIVVTLPERLVLEETRELCQALAADPGLPVGAVVVNRVPTAFPEAARVAAEAAHARHPAAGFGALAALLAAREAAAHEAHEALGALVGPGRAHPASEASSGPAAPVPSAPVLTLRAFPVDPRPDEVAAVLAARYEAFYP